MQSIRNKTVRLPEVDSTNRYFMEWITREKPEEGTLVVADRQTAGKGMDGTTWESETGQNLTFSFVLYPDFLAPDAQFYLNKIVALGLVDMVSELLNRQTDIRIKWPNDIYIGDRKVAGTLIQNGIKGSSIEYSVVGIGLNVNQEIFTGGAPNPVSLKMMTGKNYDLEVLLSEALEKIWSRYQLFRNGPNKEIDEDYLALLYRYQQLADYIYKGDPVKAMITGVNRYGQLILEIPGEKIIECDLKEIKFTSPPLHYGEGAGG